MTSTAAESPLTFESAESALSNSNGARSMFRTVSQIRARVGRSFIAENASAPVPEAFARSERRAEAVGGSRKHFPIFGAIMPTCSRSIGRVCIWYPFFFKWAGAVCSDRRAHLLAKSTPHAAPPSKWRRQASRRPSPPAGSPPQAPRAQGVRRPGPARGPERCGRLGATPGDAPVASTPPRRREPGR